MTDAKQALENKTALFEEMLEATKDLLEAVKGEDAEAMQRATERRGEIVKRIDALDREETQKPPLARLDAYKARAVAILTQIQQLDEHIRALGKEQMEAFEHKLRSVAEGKKGLNAYAHPATQEDGVYFDRKQ